MIPKTNRISELIIKQLSEELNPDEKLELEAWARLSDQNQQVVEGFAQEPMLSAGIKELFSAETRIWERLENGISKPAPVRRMFPFRRIAVAASIIVLLGLTAYFLITKSTYKGQNQPVAMVTKDVKAPTTARAMITLGDGSHVYLDSAENGMLAKQGSVQVLKTADGEIAYSGTDKRVQYNTLVNPRGSKVVNLMLADGTRVWLNAESSLRYPTVFSGGARVIELTGEAYFEVASLQAPHGNGKSAQPESGGKIPFIVSVRDMQVEVLGTHFNINSYSEEPTINTTLLEGKVRVTRGANIGLLKPGQQAQSGSNDLKIVSDADLDQVMAWKNGEFQFGEQTDIHTIMNQISRWYNVDVEYKGTVQGKIWGSISRNVPLSNVLEMLQKTGEVKFTLQDNKVIVMP